MKFLYMEWFVVLDNEVIECCEVYLFFDGFRYGYFVDFGFFFELG